MRLGQDDRFEAMDRGALHTTLLALRTCPTCRLDLSAVANCRDVWACVNCKETWHLSQEEA